MPLIDIVGPSYTVRSVSVECQRTVNLYAELDETQRGRTVGALHSTPGLRLFGVLDGLYSIRPGGLYTTGSGRCFAVRGAGFYEVLQDGTSRLLGSLLTSTGPVCLRDNSLAVVLVDGLYGYAFDLSANTFRQITDEAFLGADRVDYLGTYLLFNRPQFAQFYFTSPLSLGLNGLDVYTLTSTPDVLVSLLVTTHELWLFKSGSTEVWVETADGTNPFARVQGVALDIGCSAAQSPAHFAQSHCWLGADKRGGLSVWETQGYQPKRVSTYAVEHALKSYATVSDAIGWGESWEGHEWYVLTFPTGNATWVYDLTTQLWHERAYLDPITGALGRHRANAHTVAFEKHLIGDRSNGNLYEASLDVYTDHGSPIKRLRRTHYVASPDEGLVPHDRLQLDLETGVGLQAIDPGTGLAQAPGVDPQMALRWSKDYGQTWSSEYWVSAGHVGAYGQRAVWNRLGASRSRVYEVSTTAPVKIALTGAYLNPVTR